MAQVPASSRGTAAVQVLGPYSVSYNTAGLTTTGVVLHAFSARTLVLAATAFVSVPWTGANPVLFGIECGPDAAAPVNNPYLWTWNDLIDGGNTASYSAWPGQAVQHWIIAAPGDVLGADAFGVAGITAGTALVYALTSAL